MNLYMLDVDGVLTDEHARPNDEAIALLARLAEHHPISMVTGRGAGWLAQNILGSLSEHFLTSPPFGNPVCCAEYGGVLFRWNGEVWKHEVNTDFAPIPGDIRTEIKKRVKNIRGVFFDTDKQIMVSIEAEHTLKKTEPDIVTNGLTEAQEMLKAYATSTLGYRRTTYVCDLIVRSKQGAWMDKEYGAHQVLNRLTGTPTYAQVIGDSLSDFQMADAFLQHQIPFTFHYVGDKNSPELLTHKNNGKYHLNITNKRYAEGTIEVLRSCLQIPA